jgi:hypothetical protein
MKQRIFCVTESAIPQPFWKNNCHPGALMIRKAEQFSNKPFFK